MKVPNDPERLGQRGLERGSEGDSEDSVWRALSDPSRRRILDLLRQQPMTTGELSEQFEFTRFAVMKHLKVLEKSGLILVQRRGRERFNQLNPVPILAISRRWIRPFELLHADRLLQLKSHAEAQENETKKEIR